MFSLDKSFFEKKGAKRTDLLPDQYILPTGIEKKYPIAAFQILRGGDVFDAVGKANQAACLLAKEYAENLEIHVSKNAAIFAASSQKLTLINQATKEIQAFIKSKISEQLAYNLQLTKRLLESRPIVFDVIAANESYTQVGFPRQSSNSAAGLFWNRKEWKNAHIAFKVQYLWEKSSLFEESLVTHEMAHAIQYLSMSQAEMQAMYHCLEATFFSKEAMDEVFAIYSEREFLGKNFEKKSKKAPGVYGFTRKQWDENHLFTRFVRKFYYPHKALAGPQMGGSNSAWGKFLR